MSDQRPNFLRSLVHQEKRPALSARLRLRDTEDAAEQLRQIECGSQRLACFHQDVQLAERLSSRENKLRVAEGDGDQAGVEAE